MADDHPHKLKYLDANIIIMTTGNAHNTASHKNSYNK